MFHFNPINRVNTKDIVLASIFIMITLVCKRFFTIMVPLFGSESLKIGIEYIPAMIAGYFLSPSYAFLVGLCIDLLGLIIVPTGFPFFGFTLTMILVVLIPSLIRKYTRHINETKIGYFSSLLIILLAIIASIYIYSLDSMVLTDSVYELTYTNKFLLIGVCLLLSVAYLLLIRILKKRINDNEAKQFSVWTLCVTLVELICTLCLTPLWLEIMYGIPFVVSLCVRIIKLCIVLPLEILVGFPVIKIIRKYIY